MSAWFNVFVGVISVYGATLAYLNNSTDGACIAVAAAVANTASALI